MPRTFITLFPVLYFMLIASALPAQEQKQDSPSIGKLEDDLMFQVTDLQRLKSRFESGKIEDSTYRKKLKKSYKRLNQINQKLILNYLSIAGNGRSKAQDSFMLAAGQQANGGSSASTSTKAQKPSPSKTEQSNADKRVSSSPQAASSSNNGQSASPQTKETKHFTTWLTHNPIWIGLAIVGLILVFLLIYFFTLTRTLANHLRYVSEELNNNKERGNTDMHEMERKLERLTGTLQYMASDLSKMKTPVVRLEAPGWAQQSVQQGTPEVPSEGTSALQHEEQESAQKSGNATHNRDKEENKSEEEKANPSSMTDETSSSPNGHVENASEHISEQQENGQDLGNLNLDKDIPEPPTDIQEGQALADDMQELGKLKDQYIDKIFRINNLSVEANSLLNSLRKNKLTPESRQAAEKKLNEINEQMKQLMENDESS